MQKTYLERIGIGLVISLVLSSCSFYSPALINTPVYEEPGNFNVGASFGTTADVNFSVNPVEHLSVIANGTYAGFIGSENTPSSTVEVREFNLNRFQTELGVGYYYRLGPKIQHDFHIGYGLGETANYFGSPGDEAFSSSFNNLFFQSSMVFGGLEDDHSFVLSGKYNMLSFNDINYRIDSTSFTTNLRSSHNLWAAQFGAGLIIHFGYIDVMGQAQIIISNSEIGGDFSVRPIGVYLGFNINLDRLKSAENDTYDPNY